MPGETGEASEGVGEERWGVKVTFVTTLTGHQAPLTSLQFTTHSSSLLASGCQAGSVKIWDVQVTSVLVMEEEGGRWREGEGGRRMGGGGRERGRGGKPGLCYFRREGLFTLP